MLNIICQILFVSSIQLCCHKNFWCATSPRLLHLHPHSPKLRREALSLVGYRRENIPFLFVVYDHERVVQFSTDIAFVRNPPHLVSLLAITWVFKRDLRFHFGRRGRRCRTSFELDALWFFVRVLSVLIISFLSVIGWFARKCETT